MSDQDARNRVGDRLRSYYQGRTWKLPAKEPDFTEEDGGVPPEMWAGPVDPEGWVQWRMLPSTVTEQQIAALESGFGIVFPHLFRAYLGSCLHLFDQVRCGGHSISLPPLPSDAPLLPVRKAISSWQPLLSAQLIPFGSYGDDYGPLCFDVQASAAAPPVVWLDHELVLDLEPPVRREQVSPLIRPLFGSFAELLDRLGT